MTPHHRFLLKLHLAQVDALTAVVQQVEHQADEVLRPFREAADRLTTMPGVSETVARVIIAEIGVGHDPVSECGPSGFVGGSVSAPRRECRQAPLDPAPWLRIADPAAWAATRKKESYLILAPQREARLRGRCDSFVVETDVHYPTDVSLLWDAVRCLLRETGLTAEQYAVRGWRQGSAVDALTAVVQQVEHQADEVLRPFREAADRLTTMPGVSETVARVIIAEIGVGHDPVSECGPSGFVGGSVSAPRRECRQAPLDPAPWLRIALIQAAWAATRKKESYLIYRRSFGASKGSAVRRRPSWRSPPPC